VALNEDIAVLQQLPLLGELEPEALRLVAFASESRQFSAGEVLFREGDPTDGGYVVMGGRIGLLSSQPHNRVTVERGALIGELSLFLDGRRPATATAIDAASTLKITRPVFRRVLDEFPGSAARLHRCLAERTLGTAERLEEVRRALLSIEPH
jgi:CRP-like cAMP-binding protein